MKTIKRLIALFLVLFLIINVYLYFNIDSDYVLNMDLKGQIQSNIKNYVLSDELPKELKDSIVVMEDKRFYKHFGFDVISIARAIIKNIEADEYAEGGSTLTQQLAKNLFLSHEKKLDRKIKEIVLAVYLEILYSKEDILEMYLNVIYYGEEAYGIGDASNIYFNKDPSELTLEESAMLAGILSAPSVYNPKVNPEIAKERQKLVLELLEDNENE